MKKGNSVPVVRPAALELDALAHCRTTGSTRATYLNSLIGTAGEAACFFRPIKQQLTLRRDTDLIAWFRTRAGNSEGYQTSITAP